MNRIIIPGIAALVIVIILAAGSLFTVSQTEQVLVVQFGEVVRPIDQPGLHAKLPIIQNVIDFDRRLLAVELPGEEVIVSSPPTAARRSRIPVMPRLPSTAAASKPGPLSVTENRRRPPRSDSRSSTRASAPQCFATFCRASTQQK